MVGQYIFRLKGTQFADIETIDNADWGSYRTCRGRASRPQILRILELLMDIRADEEQRCIAVNDGVWDLLMHQYTMYSATPLALNHLLRTSSAEARGEIRDADMFVEHCFSRGTGGIFLFDDEIQLNKEGKLPIYRIEDVARLNA